MRSANAGWTPFARDRREILYIARVATGSRSRPRCVVLVTGGWCSADAAEPGALGGGRGACMCDWRARRGVPGERGAWRARADRAAAASARAPPAPCERRRVYGYLRELPAPRAKGTREAVGARRGRAR